MVCRTSIISLIILIGIIKWCDQLTKLTKCPSTLQYNSEIFHMVEKIGHSRMLLNTFNVQSNCNGETTQFKHFIFSCCREMLQKHSEGYRKHFSKFPSISANTTQSLEKKAIEKTPCLH